MTPQELKNSILQLAIQGKLVEQRAEEGTAAELYTEIQKEKQKLIKEGKIKKEKPLPEIAEDEKPFDIPESWMWCFAEEFAEVVVGATPSTSVSEYWQNGKISWLPSGCCQDCQVVENNSVAKTISQGGYDSCSTKLMPVDTVLIALTGATAGKVGLLKYEACGNQSLVGITPFYGIVPEFLFYQLMTRRKEILSDCIGSAQPHISKEYITKMLFPLPPLAEQKRIVAKIEELLPLIDRYERAWSKLEDFNKRFPTDMQKSILQMAIEGKLAPQRPEEGTGEELYRQIQAEKQKLIKEGKIKKEKPLPEITDDEKPFDIPESWKWVRLVEMVSILGDGIHGTPAYDFTGEFFFINGNNLNNGVILLKDDTKKVNKSEWEKYKKPLDDSTVLVSINGTLGNVAFYSNEKVMLGKSACYFNLINKSMKYYIYWLIKTDYFMEYSVSNATGTTIKNVSLMAMNNLLVPLPPLAEQKRIVEKLNQLLPLCERLK